MEYRKFDLCIFKRRDAWYERAISKYWIKENDYNPEYFCKNSSFFNAANQFSHHWRKDKNAL